MLEKQEILVVYQKGPQAICDFVHHLESQIQNLKERIAELENHPSVRPVGSGANIMEDKKKQSDS